MNRGQRRGGDGRGEWRGGGRGGRGGRGRGGNQNPYYEDEARRGESNRGRGNGRRGNGNRGSHNDGTQRTTYPLGMEKLKTLAGKNSDTDLIEGLTMDGSFYALINKEQQPHDDCRRLILRVLSRASQFNMAHFRRILHGLLRHVAESQFLQKWLPNDVLQLRDKLYPFSTATDAEKEEFIEEATNLLAEILDKLPDLAMEIRQTATTVLDTLKDKNAFREFRGPDGEEPPFRRAQRRLEMLWENYVERKRQQPDQAQQIQGGRFDRAPLEDFRELSILPQEEEIVTDQRPRLRSNKITGSYEGIDHYLDVQFRLLREDFVGPIREAITTIAEADMAIAQQGNQPRQQKMLSIYRRAIFQEPEFDKRSTAMLYKVRFDMTQFRRTNWETARRLLQGSLLCFSSDGFHTLFFATISNRDVKELRKGSLQVTVDTFPAGGLDRSVQYSFVESPSFFEAYKHVLKALQTIRGEQDMPFVQHLVFCNPAVQPPRYIAADGEVDFSCLVNQERTQRVIANDVLRAADWPRMEQLGLDASQFDALRQALTKRLAIVQGPPGTGKTYVGLKIVQVLLNKIAGMQMGPMLVVCFTNHALDQFLEGIAAFLPNGGQDKIVRIGGSAKMSESVKPFQLNNFLANRRDPHQLSRPMYEKRQERKVVAIKIEAMKNLTTKKSGWLTPEQVERVTGGLSDLLFEEARRHPDVVKNDVDALRVWLRDARPWDRVMPSVHELQAAYRLMQLTPFRIDTCLKAVRLTGNRDDAAALTWLNAIYELILLGCGESEACFALELHNNNAEAAFNWLQQSANERNLPDAQGQREQEQMDPGLGAAAAAQADEAGEEVEMGDEDLELERDFVDADDFMIDLELGIAAAKAETVFTKVGDKPKLPKCILNSIASARPMSAREAERALENPWQLPVSDRWRLYRYWQVRLLEEAVQLQRASEQEYQQRSEELRELQDLCLVHQLNEVKVIGMTTTGAAKKQAVLQQLKPKVVVIEEAAEVLEAHIVTSLSSGCDHLILIGDHKQLRPKPSVYELAREFNFDVSLFERLINNKFTYATLRQQHRMRPEIADVLMPKFYDDLKNHISVYNRDHVLGLNKDMYFIDHRHLEEHGDGTSHKNMHEARFMVALCKYLIQQGYEAGKITILCCYLAQMFEIKKLVLSTFPEHDRVRVAVVDNFQGEENDIILLSMVRSNVEGRVGFLNTDNRVCVALSRAKMGFYVVGNFQHLSNNSSLWNDLVGRLRAENSLGPALELRCQIHSSLRRVAEAVDFVKEAPNGGCSEMCDTRMACGHVCNQRCHPTDPRHEKTRCARQCEKTCPQGHKCPKLCSDDCGDCQVRVEKKLQCGHTVKAKCHQSREEIRCSERCNKVLPNCGHHCQQRCSDPCNPAKCFETVERQLPCGHVATLPCNRDIANYLCIEKVTKQMPTCGHVNQLACSDDVHSVRCSTPCGAILTCGDPCSGTCGQCRRGRLHKKCEEDCKRILLCSHECKEKCSKACPPCQNQCENRCVHSRCGGEKGKKGRTCGEPCPLCVEQCAWSCRHHKCNLRCYEPCQRKRCMEKCEKKLKCGHDCIGVCGETCPELCRQCDRQKYEDLLEQHDLLIPIDEEEKDTAMFVQLDDCKHLFEVSFLDTWFDERINQAKTEKAAEIKLLQCPLCNTNVRTTQRYGVVFKECLLDVQQVKTKGRGDIKELEEQRTRLALHLEGMFPIKIGQQWGHFKKAKAALLDLVKKSETCHLTKNRLTSLENLVQLLEQLAKFEETDVQNLEAMVTSRRLSSTANQTAASRFIDQFFPMSGNAAMDNELKRKELVKLIQRETAFLLNWIVRNAKSPSDQMIQEFANECRRVVLLAGLVEILLWMTNKGEDIRSQHWTEVEEIMAIFNGVNTFNTELEKNTTDKIKRLSTACGCNTGLGINETERVEIMKAVGFGQGHWFKCPNGHIYCIGECGGAMQEGTCPECHAGIGGASHRLRSDNAVASEMDGATQSAYDVAARGDAALARRLQEMWERGLNLDL